MCRCDVLVETMVVGEVGRESCQKKDKWFVCFYFFYEGKFVILEG